MAKAHTTEKSGNGSNVELGLDPVSVGNGEVQRPMNDEEIGEQMWRSLMTPNADGPTFADRWAHLGEYAIGAYGQYRVIKHVPFRIVLTGKEAVAYALGEIGAPAQLGEPVSFFDAIAKAAKPKPHNTRRNFGEELFSSMVENFCRDKGIVTDADTAGSRKEKLEAVAKAFRETRSDDPKISSVDAFLVAQATALRDSEDMRRKVKERKSGEKSPSPDATPKPAFTVDVTSLF